MFPRPRPYVIQVLCNIVNSGSGTDPPLGAVLDPVAAPTIVSEIHTTAGRLCQNRTACGSGTDPPLGAVLDPVAAPTIVSEMPTATCQHLAPLGGPPNKIN